MDPIRRLAWRLDRINLIQAFLCRPSGVAYLEQTRELRIRILVSIDRWPRLRAWRKEVLTHPLVQWGARWTKSVVVADDHVELHVEYPLRRFGVDDCIGVAF